MMALHRASEDGDVATALDGAVQKYAGDAHPEHPNHAPKSSGPPPSASARSSTPQAAATALRPKLIPEPNSLPAPMTKNQLAARMLRFSARTRTRPHRPTIRLFPARNQTSIRAQNRPDTLRLHKHDQPHALEPRLS
jgi:hypothetical protein